MNDKLEKDVYITIAGLTASGKSTVAMIIKECLRDHGFEVDFDGGVDYSNEEQFDEDLSKDQMKREVALTELQHKKIVLSEIQLGSETKDLILKKKKKT